MTTRAKFEISDWLKIMVLAAGLVIYGVQTSKDVEAQGRTLQRLENKVDALLTSNSRLEVIDNKLEDLKRRIENLEAHK